MADSGDFYSLAEQALELDESATAKWHILDAMNRDKSLSGAPFRVGFYIVKRLFSDTGYLRLPRDKIAADLGIEIRTVTRTLIKLKSYIIVNNQKGQCYSGNYYANEYTIDWLYWSENEVAPVCTKLEELDCNNSSNRDISLQQTGHFTPANRTNDSTYVAPDVPPKESIKETIKDCLKDSDFEKSPCENKKNIAEKKFKKTYEKDGEDFIPMTDLIKRGLNS